MWSVRVTLLLGAAWLVTGALARSTAAVRHAVWAAALTAALALPAVAGTLPWRWEVVQVPGAQVGPEAAPTPVAGAGGVVAVESPPAGREAGAADGPVAKTAWSPGALLLGMWAAGTLTILGLLARGGLHLARIARRSAAPAAGDLPGRVEELSARLGIRGRVRVRESHEIAVPLTWGVLRPEILLPAGAAASWPRERLEAVLLHELGHVRRRDIMTHVLGRAACALHWFNPLAWIAARRMTRECERACDDLVILSGTRASAYAEHLLSVIRAGIGTGERAPALSMARKSGLEGRILALIDPATRRGTVGRSVASVIVGVAAGLALLVSLPGPGSAATDGAGSREATREAAPHGGRELGPGHPPPAAPADPAASRGRDRTVTETLVGLLADPHSQVREAAAHSLGERGARTAVPALLAALDDAHGDVREEAAVALGRLQAASAVAPLARVLLGDRHEEVREAAAWALGEVGTPAAVASLADALVRVDDGSLLNRIVTALGQSRRPEAVQVLERILVGADPRLQRRSLEALAAVGSEEALDVLIRGMRSDDPQLRRAAAKALGEGR